MLYCQQIIIVDLIGEVFNLILVYGSPIPSKVGGLDCILASVQALA